MLSPYEQALADIRTLPTTFQAPAPAPNTRPPARCDAHSGRPVDLTKTSCEACLEARRAADRAYYQAHRDEINIRRRGGDDRRRPGPARGRRSARCGTVAGHQAHIRYNETPCEACLEAKRAADRAYYQAHRDEINARRRVGANRRPRAACGTRAGYQAHRARDEKPCEACREAHRAYNRVNAAQRRQRKADQTAS